MTSRARKRRAVQSPTVTAGLKCPPETWPTAYAIVSTDKPKANETPSSPMPTAGNAAASTALPQPPSTSQSVPKNSAVSFCESEYSFIVLFLSRSRVRGDSAKGAEYESQGQAASEASRVAPGRK